MAVFASVDSVYQRLKVLLNKQQLGFVTPTQFDRLATQAQQEIFNEDIGALSKIMKYKIRNLETANADIEGALKDNLRPLLIYGATLTNTSGSLFSFPDRYAYLVSIEQGDNIVTVVSPEESIYYKNNRYPSKSGRAVAVVGNNVIEMIPTTITSGVTMSYYKYPLGSRNGTALAASPTWAYSTSGEDLIYNSSTSVDFELPKHLEERIVDKMMSLLGITLRDGDSVQYAEMKEQQNKAE